MKRCHLGMGGDDVGGLCGRVDDERTVVVYFKRVGGVMICMELILNVDDMFSVVRGLCESCGGSSVLAFLIVGVFGVAALVVSMAWSGDA